MPIHDLGYRGWKGALSSEKLRWTIIAETGVRLVWKNMWLRRMLFFAWLPAASIGLLFFFYEQSLGNPNMSRFMFTFFSAPFFGPFSNEVLQNMNSLQAARGAENAEMMTQVLKDARHSVWAFLLMVFFRYPQGVLMVMMIGLIAPRLVAQDVRSKAFLLYFSKPITPLEYILGKAAILWCYLALITTLPALLLYLLGVLLSPDLEVVFYTWDLPLRIIVASVVLMIPTASLALLFSSMTSESRYAGFSWFAIWVLGWVAYGILSRDQFGTSNAWSIVSLYHMLGDVQSWVFGLKDFQDILGSAIVLTIITIASICVLFHRVTAPIRL